MLFRIGLFYCAAPLSGAFGGLLATGLAQIRHGGYDRILPILPQLSFAFADIFPGWPWIFIVEGVSSHTSRSGFAWLV